MSKREKDVILQLGITREEYNQMTGINTRTRNHTKTEIHTPDPKIDERKKTPAKKEGYIPPTVNQQVNLTLLEFNEFQTYVQDLLKRSNEDKNSYISMPVLYSIYKQTNSKGGVVQVSSINGFCSIVRSAVIAAQSPQMEPELTEALIQKVRQLLFSIQFTLKNVNAQKKIYQLGLVNFVDKQQLREHVKDKKWGLNYFNYDLTLFQQGAQSIKIDESIFNLDYMCSHYKKQKIDIRIQNPLDYGFKPSKLKNKKHEMTLGQYRFYQLNFLDPSQMRTFKHSQYLGKGQIFFGVNFQPSDQMLNREIKKNVQGTFLDYHGDFDMMSFLDTDIPGCSLPQMYFKTPGCWTGGHQQNISMSALNINHGPDYSQWYTLELKHIDRLRKELIQEFNTDLYLSQGLWYQKLDWFMSRGYPVKRFLQRKDDIVVTGPGTLHWVRSFGVALQTSWNIMPKNYEQFQAAFARHKANKQIRFHKSDTIPLKSLILKYLNHERTIMKQNIRILCTQQLEDWLKQQEDIVDQMVGKIKQVSHFYLRDLESFCCLCKQEVLVYFLPAPGDKKQGISCLECFKKSQHFNTHFVEDLYHKRQVYWVNELIRRCRDNDLSKLCANEIQQLCKGIHVGKIEGKCTVAQKLEQQLFPIKQPEILNDEQQIKNTQREIFYNNENLFPLYQNFFKNITESVKQLVSQLDTSKDKIRPVSSRSCKMMTALQEGEMIQKCKQQGINTYVSMVNAVEASCQTQVKYPQIQEKQIGELSKSRSREKKKKKQKSKKKHKKKKSDSPKFSSDSQQKKRNSSGSVSSGYKRNNSRRSGSNFMDNNRGSRNDRGSYQVNDRGNDRNYDNRDGDRNRDRYNGGDGYRNNNRNYDNNRFDRNQQGGGNFNRNNYDNDNGGGGFRGRRDFGDNNDNGGGGFRGRRDFGDNNRDGFDNRGRGGRGRGGRGRGGFNNNRDNFNSDRNDGDNNRNNNDDNNNNNNDDNNRQNDNFGSKSNEPKCDAPDEY